MSNTCSNICSLFSHVILLVKIIGFDIILTEQLKPFLLEVNANPSLRIDFDREHGMNHA
jgi:D-alanine-D-alanine ligase-like ATP-grasp enzyme